MPKCGDAKGELTTTTCPVIAGCLLSYHLASEGDQFVRHDGDNVARVNRLEQCKNVEQTEQTEDQTLWCMTMLELCAMLIKRQQASNLPVDSQGARLKRRHGVKHSIMRRVAVTTQHWFWNYGKHAFGGIHGFRNEPIPGAKGT